MDRRETTDAVWIDDIDYEAAIASPVPVFTPARIRARNQRPHVVYRGLRHPLLTVGALKATTSVRDTLRLLAWLDTAQVAGWRSATVAKRGHRHVVTLPRPRRPEPESAATIGVTMIAQDEAPCVAKALASARDFVDEIVVVDGGSKDDTVAICETFGARVIHRNFDGDFSAQRNAALDVLTTDWALVLDADETLTPELGAQLRRLARFDSYDVVFTNRLLLIDDRDTPEFWPSTAIRLHRRHLRYERQVHERLPHWKRALYLPLSGPSVIHRNSSLRFRRSGLRYAEMVHGEVSPGDAEWLRREVARLEAEHRATENIADVDG